VRKTSPEFVMDALNQQAQPIGPQALGLAWTDDPFLNGCEINLERFPQMRKFAKGTTMARDWYVKTDKFGSVYGGKSRQQADQKAEELMRQGAKWWEIIDPDNSSVGGGYVEHEKEAGVEEKDSPEHFGRKAMMEACWAR
jgi:hypothetical protein